MRATPPWIAAANLPSGAPTRHWTAAAEGNLTCTDIELEMSVRNISQSARAALTLGTLEWVICRFADRFADERPHQFLDAAWAVLADPSHVKLDSYLDSWDVYDDDPSFYKPVDLAFWYACESVCAVSLGRWMFEAPGAGLRIARWVNDDTESVATWWRTILTRLEQDHPASLRIDSPEPGPALTRDVLDPSRLRLDPPSAAQASLALDPASNPFLKPREETDEHAT